MKLAGKPGSVVDSHSSGPYITARLKPPTRKLGGTRQRLPIRCCSGWRLPRFTPTGCMSGAGIRCRTPHALAKLRRLAAAKPGYVNPSDSSLWPCSSPHGGRALPVTLPCGARTFLYARHGWVAPPGLFRTQRLPGQLHCGFYHRGPCDTARTNTILRTAPDVHAPPRAGDADDDRARPAHQDDAMCSPGNRCWARVHRNTRR